jgi:ABC-2 type transport system ATP-binding protein
MKKPVVKVKNASKSFQINRNRSIRQNIMSFFNENKNARKLQALDDVTFDVKEGEVFGIVGKNGSGKSTLFKAIMNAIKLDSGTIETKGKLVRLALGMGFDFNLSARQNIYMNASMLGMTFKEIGMRFEKILKYADVEKFVDTELKYYSSGMKSRLSFSIAIHTKADVFLMDEFFGGVGDINFRRKSFELFQNTIVDNKTILYITHNMDNIEKYCHRAMLMHEGAVLLIDDPKKVVKEFKRLMKSKN